MIAHSVSSQPSLLTMRKLGTRNTNAGKKIVAITLTKISFLPGKSIRASA